MLYEIKFELECEYLHPPFLVVQFLNWMCNRLLLWQIKKVADH